MNYRFNIKARSDSFSRVDEWINYLLFSKKVFIFFSISLLIYVFIGSKLLYSPVESDYWEHLSSIGAFSRNLLSPENPFLATKAPTHLFTPYHFFWGAISKVVNIHPFYLLPIIGIFNISIFLIACCIISKYLLNETKYALIIALTMFFFWIRPWPWSGFYSFSSLPIASVYPYWFAFPLSLIIISLYPFRRRFLTLCCIPLISIVFLIHPITGSFLFLSLYLKSFTDRSISFNYRIVILLSITAAFAISCFWPFYPIIKAILTSQKFHELGFSGDYRFFYKSFYIRLLPSFLGLVYVFHAITSKRADFTIKALFLFSTIYFLNYVLFHSGPLGRYVIYVAFFLHLSVVFGIKFFEKSKSKSLVLICYVIIFLSLAPFELFNSIKYVGIFRNQVYHNKIGYSLNARYFREFQAYSRYIDTHDVVLANMDLSSVLPGIIGCKVVAVQHSNPFLHDYYERKNDVITFFKGKTSLKDRLYILRKHNVKFIIIPKVQMSLCKNIKDNLQHIFEDKENIVFKVL